MKVDAAKLKLFIDVLDAGSVTAGARRCHLSLAAASSRLQELESALGVRLFERHASGVRPTDAGEALMWSGEILDSLHRRKADLGVLADSVDKPAWPERRPSAFADRVCASL